jgi:hypothetical protein
MKDTDEIKFTVKEIREIAEAIPVFKRAIERIKPDVFEKPDIKQGDVLIKKDGISSSFISFVVIAKSPDKTLFASCPEDCLNFWNDKPVETLHDKFRPMRSGTITITVKDGNVDGAVVKED